MDYMGKDLLRADRELQRNQIAEESINCLFCDLCACSTCLDGWRCSHIYPGDILTEELRLYTKKWRPRK